VDVSSDEKLRVVGEIGTPAKPGRFKASDTQLLGPTRWREWKRLLEDGTFKTASDLARAIGVSRAAVTQGLKKLAFSR